jgi:hypothetical protein
MLELLAESMNCHNKIAHPVVRTQRMVSPVILPGCLRQPTYIDESQHLSSPPISLLMLREMFSKSGRVHVIGIHVILSHLKSCTLDSRCRCSDVTQRLLEWGLTAAHRSSLQPYDEQPRELRRPAPFVYDECEADLALCTVHGAARRTRAR